MQTETQNKLAKAGVGITTRIYFKIICKSALWLRFLNALSYFYEQTTIIVQFKSVRVRKVLKKEKPDFKINYLRL